MRSSGSRPSPRWRAAAGRRAIGPAGLVLLLLAAGEPAAAERPFEVLAHDLTVELFPAEHRLRATDRITIKTGADQLESLVFTLHPDLQVTQVREVSAAGRQPLQLARDHGKVIVWLAGRPAGEAELTLAWEYEGAINDPPREPRHLRFVTPSETSGHIGVEGVYLSGETHWYPDAAGSLPTYRLTVTVPEGWESVSHGSQRERRTERDARGATVTSRWDVAAKTEALTLVANRFVKTSQDWRGIEVAAYLFPEEAALGEEYLAAAIRYLEVYTKLLGPYPFPKFAVVENFFASGLGMPSFTLLGSGIIKRHYVQPYALGHEIVHSWFGNSVFNDNEQGNWVEGLTTYLANYYYEELTGTADQAREQRRLMLLGYGVYVRPEEDYPVGRFTHKSDQKDNAIGYQKAAMVFHMLRAEVGDAAFWDAIRALVTERTGTYVTWQDLEHFFGRVAGRDLRWFFAQWIERPGAPVLGVTAAKVPAPGRAGGSESPAVAVTVTQAGEPYRLRLPLAVTMANGETHRTVVELSEPRQALTVPLPSEPLRLRLDPDVAVFRRLERDRLPPMLNLFVTDRERTVVLPGGTAAGERSPYEGLADRLAGQDAGGARPVRRMSDREALGPEGAVKAPGSVLVLGGPGFNQAAAWATRGCGGKVSVAADRFLVNGQSYEGGDKALLVTCRHPDRPDGVVTLFYGLSPAAASKVARLLFFYGWQSYLVFRDGTVVARGDFPPGRDDLEVRF
jgi:aminopeptidase N